ncbi:hypothetical protein HA402_002204 [Bradysia odoriphaga]|nr:hypothetical protein HA402_002204 [Bradysia odoriphaga]
MVKIVLTFVLFTTIFERILTQNLQDAGNVFIDVTTQRFLDLESMLWKEIEQNAYRDDRTPILQRIHTEFLKFYSRPLIADETAADRVTIFNQTLIESQIFDAERTVTIVKNHILQRDVDRSLDRNVIGTARSYDASLLDNIYHIAVERDYFGLIKENGNAQNCSNQYGLTIASTSDILMQQYEIVAKARLKAYSIPQLYSMLLTVYNIGNKIDEASVLRKRFIDQSKMLQKRVRELMGSAKRDIWKCDMAADFYDGKDNQVTHLLDGYIDNEVNLNNDNDCTQTCSDYKVAKNFGCFEGTYCEQQVQPLARCRGTVVDCQFIDWDLEVCPSASNSERRFESLEYASGRTIGNPNLCHIPKTKIHSWWRWFVRCSNCFCFCDEPSEKSDRYFSLQPALSDTNQNKVITGIALRKINRIFFWGITQATLLNNGQLNDTRYYYNSWKKTKEFYITDIDVVDGVDYHTLSWQNRSIYLDTLVAPPGYVLTGIRFNSVNGNLVLSIRVTRFDFKSGRLFDSFEWISNKNENRQPIELDRPAESSDKEKSQSIPYTSENRYVRFQPTDIDKDGGQTTVPFIDVQLAEPPNERPTLLSGAGIYFKGEAGFGGFVAPKVVTYDFAQHIGHS